MNTKRISDVIDKNDIVAWTEDVPIIISAGTGAGKSYFVKNTLYEVAKQQGEKILMLIHRRLCIDQFQMEIDNDGKSDIITLMTYQKVDKSIIKKEPIDLNKFHYIVCDEFHYFLSDSKFNNATDLSFNQILSCNSSIRIMMSATSDDITEYIDLYKHMEIKKYTVDRDWSFIESLTFFYNRKTLYKLADTVVENKDKAIFFIDSASEAYKLYEANKSNALFCCGKGDTHKKYVKKTKINNMLQSQKFKESMLITTSCLDAGVNIIDTKVKYIIADIRDIDSLIQCIGRKRQQGATDTIHLYVRAYNGQSLGGTEKQYKDKISMADYVKDYGGSAFTERYGRRQYFTGLIYDDIEIDDSGKSQIVKKVNEMQYRKIQLQLKEISEIKTYGKYSYCKLIASKFGRYDPVTQVENYDIYPEIDSKQYYLKTQINKIMYTPSDRKELIKKINVKSGKRQLKSQKALNASLEEEKLPFKIKTVDVTNPTDRKRYRHAWKVITWSWNSS